MDKVKEKFFTRGDDIFHRSGDEELHMGKMHDSVVAKSFADTMNGMDRRLAATYAPDRITPEVVVAAARGMRSEGERDDPIEQWELETAKAALLAAFAVLGCA